MSFAAICAAVDALKALQASAIAASAAHDDDWRRELVRIRRATATVIADLMILSRDWSPPAGLRPGAHDGFRTSLNEMRHILALHQAMWPAVSIDVDAPDFRASAMGVRTAFDTLFARSDDLKRAVQETL